MDRSFLLDSVRHISRHYELLGENIDMAERNGGDLRRLLVSAEFFRDCAIFFGSFHVKTPFSKSRASLSRITFEVQFSGAGVLGFCDIFKSGDIILICSPLGNMMRIAGQYDSCYACHNSSIDDLLIIWQ